MVTRIAIVFGIIVLGFLAREILRWRVPGRMETRRQKVYRVATALIIIVALVMIVLGSKAIEAHDPLTAFLYWAICLVLAFVLALLSMLDLRELRRVCGEHQKQLYRNLAKHDEETDAE